MAASESQFQSEFMSACRHQLNAHVFKVTETFSRGTPDLYVCTSFWRGWVELKFENAPVMNSTPIKINLSPNQREFLRREQEAGGFAGWVTCVKYTSRLWRVFAGDDPDVERINQDDYIATRMTGTQWEARPILLACSGGLIV